MTATTVMEALGLLAAVCAFVWLMSRIYRPRDAPTQEGRIQGHEQRIALLERQVAALMRQADLEAPAGREQGGELDPVRELARSGQKIAAIKLYRERTGVGLREAKEAVDAMEREA